jgi:hypothetical protein
MLPNFIVLIDILVIMLFSLIIAQGANNYISSEGSNVKFIKTLPISPFIQIVVKVALPYVLSAISLIVSLLILRITKEISTSGFFAALIYTLLMLFVFNLVSLFEELKIKRNKPRTNYISNLYSYLIPLSIFIIGVLLSYFRVSIYLVYLIGLGIIIVSSLPYLVNIKKKVEGLFLALEVEN